MPLQPGDKLGQYEILSEIGRGGMATVFKARQPSMGRDVAAKVLPEQFLHDPTFLARFSQEARVIAALEHPRILPVYDFGEAAGVPYIVMRMMAHGSLRGRLRAGPLPPAEAARLVAQVAEALDFAHRRGVIHRDLKPDNVLLDEAGNAYLSDFGIAKVMAASSASIGTTTIGTPSYMAPEQVWGRKPQAASDVYALGVMTIELLTGRPPFEAENPLALMHMHAYDPLPRLADLKPGLPAGLQAVLDKALAKEPEARYASAGEFAGALAASIGEPAPASPPRPPSPARRAQPEGEASPTPPTPAAKLEPHGQPTAVKPDRRPAGAPGARQNVLRLGGLAVGGGTLLVAGVVVLAGLVWAGVQLFGGNVPGQPPGPTEISQAATIGPTSAAAPTQVAAPTALSSSDGAALVFVPAGDFQMGSEDGETDEAPVHTVHLDDFWIDRTGVTNAMYAVCVGAGACQEPISPASNSRSDYYGAAQYAAYPVLHISWSDANDYCLWAGRRLPTEAEREKAARGTDGRKYPWGDEAPAGNLLNFADRNTNFDWSNKSADDGYADTAPVGSYPDGASPYGALDMAGNVWEWVADWYAADYYSVSPAQNPPGPASGLARVGRGGSWYLDEGGVRATNRYDIDGAGGYEDVGFRCARSP